MALEEITIKEPTCAKPANTMDTDQEHEQTEQVNMTLPTANPPLQVQLDLDNMQGNGGTGGRLIQSAPEPFTGERAKAKDFLHNMELLEHQPTTPSYEETL